MLRRSRRAAAPVVAALVGLLAGAGPVRAARQRPPAIPHRDWQLVRQNTATTRQTLREITGATDTRVVRRPLYKPSPTPIQGAPTLPPTTISVDATHPGATISPALFGSDFLAPEGGMGAWDDSTGGFWPSFTQQLASQVQPGSLRFPGGITGQAWDWTRSVGAQASRTDNPIGPGGGPSPSTVGPDEFGQLLDLTGAVGVMDVDFEGPVAETADLVQYMTATSGPFAQQRAANGHPQPYDVPYWEVGNEEDTANGWRSAQAGLTAAGPAGCVDTVTCAYIYGGTGTYSNQSVVQPDDRSASAAVSDGETDQTFQVQFPPVDAGTLVVKERTSSGTTTASGYTVDDATGAITFTSPPPEGATIIASYQSTHGGFEDFYAAMKAADPSIQVCATDPSPTFVADMGSDQPYDCLQDHPYVGTGAIGASLPIAQYEQDVMAVPARQMADVQSLQGQVDQTAGRHVALVLTEYGQLINSSPDPLDVPYYLNSLDEALLNASQLVDWISLGIAVADRQLLDAELPDPTAVTVGLPAASPFATSGAITSPGPQTVVQPTGQYLGLLKPLAGGALLASSASGDPNLTTSAGVAPTSDLATVAAATSGGLQLVVINRSPSDDVPAALALAGVTGSGTARVTTLDGPDALSDNTAAEPTTVTSSVSTTPMVAGQALLTFPAHSITLVTLPGF